MTGIRFSAETGKWVAVLDADPFNPSPEWAEGEQFLVESGTLTNAAQNLLWALSQRLIAESNAARPTLLAAEGAARDAWERNAQTRAVLRAHLLSQGAALPDEAPRGKS